MPIMAVGMFDTAVSESDIKEANFKHVCLHVHYTRSFSNKHGLSIHVLGSGMDPVDMLRIR